MVGLVVSAGPRLGGSLSATRRSSDLAKAVGGASGAREEGEPRLAGAVPSAHAAHNVAALGARVVPVGVIGRDGAGEALLALFQRAGITTHGLVVEAGRMTPMKTRIMAGGYPATRQQVVQIGRASCRERV